MNDTLLRAFALIGIYTVLCWLDSLSRWIAERVEPAGRARLQKERGE